MPRLSYRRRVFVEEYVRCWNASEAARRAGYAHPRQYGHHLLSLEAVTDEIKKRVEEKAMTADEVLLRLAEQARADYTPYLMDDGSVDLARMLADGKGHMVKGVRWDRAGNRIIEFHDSQAALVHIGRHLQLFTENINHNVTGNALIALLPDIEDEESDDAVETT